MNILGLKYDHDSALALLTDGTLAVSIEAEKDSHPRHSFWSADRLSEKVAGLPAVPDVLAVGGWWQCDPGYMGIDGTAVQSKYVRVGGKRVRYFSSSHERSHILAAYGLSPFAQGVPCYVLVWEGEIGAFYSIDEALKIVKVADVLDRPGHRYAFLFELADASRPGTSCGLSYDSAGKLMALTGYSSGSPASRDEEATVRSILDGFGTSVQTKQDLAHSLYFNVGVQDRRFTELARRFSDALFDRFYCVAKEKLTNRWPLLVSGGCGLNGDWNRRWRNCGLFPDVFVPPCPNDSGSALGTAIDAQHFYTGSAKVTWSVYAGEEFQLDEPAGPAFECSPLAYDDVTSFLCGDHVIAWVQGRYEIGPRALGNRSILALPFRRSVRDRLNSIKLREEYRPIAPVCLEDQVEDFFDWIGPSPYMLFFQRVIRGGLDAVTHVDGTARIQTVRAEQNEYLYRLLDASRAKTGVGVLCNTSLNFKGQGFINRMSDLVRFVSERGLDGMVVGDQFYKLRRSFT